MSENISYFKVKKSSERNFAFVFAVFFILLGFYFLYYGNNFKLWTFIIAIILFIIGIFVPRLLFLPNKLWFKFGTLIGNIIAPIVMGFLFFFIITPTNMILRLLRKDPLRKKINKSTNTYWIKRKTPEGSMKNQF
tara:strand:+ start:468 stop:872 length:405 start_codon:yes stop_codon:yes gene_type:complete